MPEGPEVRIISDCLNDVVCNLSLNSIKFLNNSKVYSDCELFSSDYTPLYNDKNDYYYIDIYDTCHVVTSYGKKVCFLFDEFIIVSSLNMEGRWTFKKDSNTSIVLEFGNGVSIYFKDTEKRANFSICNYESYAYNHIFNTIGYDLMDDRMTCELFVDVITNKRIKNKKLFEFLLDQKYVSGIGFYLCPEIIYVSMLMFDRTLGSLNNEEIIRLYKSIKTIMNLSYKLGGLTIATYCDPYGRTGKYEPKIYRKKITERGEIVKVYIYQNSRKFYYCEF